MSASNRECSIEGCANRGYTKRTWCNKHYQRWKNHGDPLGGGRSYATPEEAFEARTKWDERGCLVWTGSLKKGYGQMSVGTANVATHRYSYERSVGVVPEGMYVDHRCHNRACANPKHLRLATPKQNLENRSGPPSSSTSGYRGVSWSRGRERWEVQATDKGKKHCGGLYKPYEIHVAAYYARELRNRLFTHNDLDRREPIAEANA